MRPEGHRAGMPREGEWFFPCSLRKKRPKNGRATGGNKYRPVYFITPSALCRFLRSSLLNRCVSSLNWIHQSGTPNFYKEPFERWLIDLFRHVIREIFYNSIGCIENFMPVQLHFSHAVTIREKMAYKIFNGILSFSQGAGRGISYFLQRNVGRFWRGSLCHCQQILIKFNSIPTAAASADLPEIYFLFIATVLSILLISLSGRFPYFFNVELAGFPHPQSFQ